MVYRDIVKQLIDAQKSGDSATVQALLSRITASRAMTYCYQDEREHIIQAFILKKNLSSNEIDAMVIASSGFKNNASSLLPNLARWE